MFTREEDRVRIQLQLLTNILIEGGQFCILEDLQTQVGILTGNSASTSDFKWSHEHFSVSWFVSEILNDIQLTCRVACGWFCKIGC